MKHKKWGRALGAVVAICLASSALQAAKAEAVATTVYINEVESSDANGGNDWVEIVNSGSEAVDVSGWYITDDKGTERVDEGSAYPIPQGTVLEAGAVLVLEETVNFDFGLGKEDAVTLYDAEGNALDTYSWSGHAEGTYSRTESGEFVDMAPTKGGENTAEVPEQSAEATVVINEVNSSPDDYVELMNLGQETLDLTGFELRDNSDDHRWQFPAGTTLAAGELLLVKADSLGLVFDDQTDTYVEGVFDEAIGIGSGDAIRLYDGTGQLLDSHSWTEHANVDGDESASWGRYPNGTGSFVLMPETAGTANSWYAPDVVINEVESNGDDTDWVEIFNAGTEAVDISGWYLFDDDSVGHAAEIAPVAEGTVLQPGGYYVFDTNVHFTFGLGKADSVTVYNKDGVVIDTYSWETHAEGVYARIPDGTGAFVDFGTATKGKANVVTNPVILNEVQSNDPGDGPDWIELANPTDANLDISGILIRDDDDAHGYVIPEGTVIPAKGFLVITGDVFGFGLGKDDMVRLYEGDLLIASTAWSGHTDPTWGLYPDMHGTEYRATAEATPGAANQFAGIPEVESWPGDQSITASDFSFLEDSSGLDIHDGKLYAVDNGTGKFWILDMAADGTLSFAEGFENGKTVNFASRDSAKGPDTEGITVDGDGYVYLASERDNSDKGVNFNVIIMADPDAEGDALVAIREWNLTASLPDVAANTGIEAVEWVSNGELAGKLFDRNTNDVFDGANYPDAVAGGVFFVALEDNGHVYAYVLNADGSSIQIADLDPILGGAMALDYDTYEHQLWVVADDGFGNMAAKLTFNGKAEPQIVHIAPPSGLDVTMNNEGFAIADASYTVDGLRPVYRFTDGVISGALTIGYIDCDYVAEAPHTHSFTNYVSNGDATCEADGTKTAKCDGCDEIDTVVDVGSRKGHTYEDGKCVDCGAEEQEQIPVTGDGTDVYPWLALLSGALLMLTILWDAKKQRI